MSRYYIKDTDTITAWMACKYDERQDIMRHGTFENLRQIAKENFRLFYEIFYNEKQCSYDDTAKQYYIEF